MTAVTVIEQVFTDVPSEEVANIVFVDGYTYTCKRLAKIHAATVSFNADPGTTAVATYVTFSGAVATLNNSGCTGATATLVLRGTL